MRIVADEPLVIHADEPLASFYQLSPFVWREGHEFHALVRAVNYADDPAKKVARIYHGASPDGITFYMDEAPAIAPGPEAEDRDGCEDPSVARADGELYVYYTGWNQDQGRGSLMLARGTTLRDLRKCGVALASRDDLRNPKEAEVVRGADGIWRLFFEYSDGERSLAGVATSDRVDGPWHVADPPFGTRAGSWDDWHLSPGPIVRTADTCVMFYNGASRSAKWRIGCIRFDLDFTRVLERSTDPIVEPTHPRDDETDIAFAASALVEGDLVRLYYSVADQYMRRATLYADEVSSYSKRAGFAGSTSSASRSPTDGMSPIMKSPL